MLISPAQMEAHVALSKASEVADLVYVAHDAYDVQASSAAPKPRSIMGLCIAQIVLERALLSL
jgi:hypothetical protein